MGVINMLMKMLSSGLGITVSVLIIWVFHMINISHQCCINLEEYAPALIMLGYASTII